MKKEIYMVCIDEVQSQPVADEIESIWLSKRKAEKRKMKLIEDGYDKDNVVIVIKEILK